MDDRNKKNKENQAFLDKFNKRKLERAHIENWLNTCNVINNYIFYATHYFIVILPILAWWRLIL